MTDEDLARAGKKQSSTGSRLLMVAAVMFAIGLALVLIGDDFVNFLGVVFMALSAPIAMGAAALLGSALVSRRSSQHKPFA